MEVVDLAIDSLWGDDFVIQPTPKVAKKIIKKIAEPKDTTKAVTKAVKSRSIDIRQKLDIIYENVKRILGRYAENTQVIKTKEDLHNYITKALENGVIALDTETDNSLDPITCKLMGPCLYTPGLKNAYVPVNHIDINTGNRLEWQVTEDEVAEELNRLGDCKVITHNGKFDYEVFKCTTGYVMKMYWDTMVGAKLLDENERSYGLKQQYIAKIDSSIEKYSIEHLFEGVEYAVVDPDIFALYAATDSFMTYKLYEYQLEQFNRPDHKRLKSLMLDIEMPVTEVSAEMELTGVAIDKEYSARLSKKYHKELDGIVARIDAELKNYEERIKLWRMTEEANFHPTTAQGKMSKSKSEQLEDPVNIGSPTQLAILLYDVLKHEPVDKKKPRGTGEEELKKIKEPICELILEYRGAQKLITTYVDKFVDILNPKTGRLHAHFNTLGAGTGRFSSSDPNLQNIPSHRKDIRLMFCASPGYSFVGSDYSAQEPRLLSAMASERAMLEAYRNGQDLYAVIAQKVYNNGYWDNMEHWEDGSPNPDGKKRRSEAKSILLGLMYGRGTASIAEQMGCTYERAQEVTDKFFSSFPDVKTWVNKTQEDAKKFGYVEDFWGRRRRLPDIQLPQYTIIDKNASDNSADFNPLLGCRGLYKQEETTGVKKYQQLLANVKSRKDYENIKAQALKEGIEIRNNGSFIAQAERQCVNRRIQGSAATLTKIAMNKIHVDKE